MTVCAGKDGTWRCDGETLIEGNYCHRMVQISDDSGSKSSIRIGWVRGQDLHVNVNVMVCAWKGMCGRFPARISQNDGMLRPTIVATNCWSAFITKRHIAMSPKSRESEVLLMMMVAEGGSTVV